MSDPSSPALAIDIGGTKVAAALIDSRGQVLGRSEESTEDLLDSDNDDVGAGLEAMVQVMIDGPIAGIGVGSAGPIDVLEGTISPVNIPSWNRFRLVERIQRLVGDDLPVRLAGDGITAALGEHWIGACRGIEHALVAVISTGIGGGVVSKGRVLTGRTGNAGHVGHTIIDFAGEPCVCGGRGCVEVYASGPAMVREALASGWHSSTPDGHSLLAAARDGDPLAVGAVDRGAAAIAAMLASQGAAFDLRYAVLGGGIMQSHDVMLPRIEHHLAAFAGLSFLDDFVVVPAALGSDAGLVGAARLIHQPDAISSHESS